MQFVSLKIQYLLSNGVIIPDSFIFRKFPFNAELSKSFFTEESSILVLFELDRHKNRDTSFREFHVLLNAKLSRAYYRPNNKQNVLEVIYFIKI